MSPSLVSLFRERPTPELARALLLALYDLFASERTKGQLALERHVDDAHDSPIFLRHAALRRCPWLMEPLLDTLRHLVFGMSKYRVVGDILNGVIEAERQDLAEVKRRVVSLVVITVAAGYATLAWTTSPLLISAVAVLVCLETVLWFAVAVIADRRLGLLRALRLGLVHHCDGYAPKVAAEIARQALPRALRPSHHAFVTATLTDSQRASEESPEDNVLAVLRDISNDIPPSFVDPVLAFNCLSLLDQLELAALLRRIDKDKLVVALLGASSGMVMSLFHHLGSRVVPLLARDMIMRRAASVADILAAQKEIAALAAGLMRSGEIAVIREVLERMPEPGRKEEKELLQ
ncbi:MAG: FliG C-terminal domain-containing protein [Candidatus Zixiibacteriota bacterium]